VPEEGGREGGKEGGGGREGGREGGKEVRIMRREERHLWIIRHQWLRGEGQKEGKGRKGGREGGRGTRPADEFVAGDEDGVFAKVQGLPLGVEASVRVHVHLREGGREGGVGRRQGKERPGVGQREVP
jgi:hypothetical protein